LEEQVVESSQGEQLHLVYQRVRPEKRRLLKEGRKKQDGALKRLGRHLVLKDQ